MTSNRAISDADRNALLHHLHGVESALLVVAQDDEKHGAEEANREAAQPNRNPDHFQANGRYLSEAGQRCLFGLFDQGHSIRSAAAIIGISSGPAADHHRRWLAAKPTGPTP